MTKRWVVAGGAVAGVVVVGAGAAALVGLGGSGPQPDEAVPADVVAFAQLDLDPSLAEKVDLFRFLRQFDVLAGELPEDDEGDPREGLVEDFLREQGLDWTADVEPWLGQRFAVAALPELDEAGEPQVLGVLQVTDEAAAQATLDRLTDEGPQAAVIDGWAYVADDEAALAEVVGGAWTPLAEHEPYRAVIDQVPAGVVRAYVDSGGLATVTGPSAGTSPGQPSSDAQVAIAIDVAPSSASVVAVSRAAEPPGFPVVDGELPARVALTALPVDTLAALQVRGAGEALVAGWDGLLTAVESAGAPDVDADVAVLEDSLGLALPEDLGTALGGALLVSAQPHADDAGPGVGYSVQTDAAAAEDLLARLDAAAVEAGGAPLGLFTSVEDDVVSVATDEDTLAVLDGTGTLGDDPRVSAAIPELDAAFVAGWVDLDGVVDALDDGGTLPTEPDAVQALEQLDALGWSVRVLDDRTAALTLRVTTAAPPAEG